MPTPSAARTESVLRATERWRKDLVDTSGRNRLRRYRDLKTSTLDLTPGQAPGLSVRALERLLADKPVSLGALFSEPLDDPGAPLPLDDARRRLKAIHKTALTNSEEKGIETCFAAIGLATWNVEQGTEPIAPVILLPLEVEATGAAARDFRIEVAGDAHINPVLAHILGSEHDIDTETDEADVAEDPPTDLEGFRGLLAQLSESWSALPGLVIQPRIVVAIFSYSTMPLVTDLEENGELFAQNDIVAAIAGDGSAREALASRICDPDPNQPDHDPPKDEFLVLDADSSQHMAINRVLGGESLVIQGPPGTGKSQTIANLITTLIARGKRVLFVAEKRAAIEAVTKRLEQVGLSDLVMDMHGRITSRRDFARTLADSLGHVATIPARDYSSLHGRLEKRRASLIDNDAALHEPRDPWKLCVFHMRERLLAVPEAAGTSLRLSSSAARKLDGAGFERLAGEIEEWVDLGGHTLDKGHPEWARSAITTRDEAREAFDLVRDLAHEKLPTARDSLFAAFDEVGLASPATVEEWRQAIAFLSAVEKTLERCQPTVYELDHATLRNALTLPAGSTTAQIRDRLLKESLEVEREGFGLVIRLGDDLLPKARDALFAALDEVGLNRPEKLRAWQEVIDSLSAVEEMLDRCTPDIYEVDHAALCEALAPAGRGGLARLAAQLFSKDYRQGKKTLQDVHRQPDTLPSADLLRLAEEAGEQASAWKKRSSRDGAPRLPTSLGEARRLLEDLLSALDDLGERGDVRDVREQSDSDLAEMLATLKSHWEGRQDVASALRASGRLTASDALALLDETAGQNEEWRRRGGDGTPRLPSDLGDAGERLGELAADLAAFAKIVDAGDLERTHHDELAQMLERLAAQRAVVASLPRIREIEKRFRATGVTNVMKRVGEDIPPELAPRAVEHAWLRRVLDDIEFDDRRLSAFDGDGHSRHRDEFAESDRQHLESTPQRVHRLTAEAIVAAMNLHQEETVLVKREAAKKRRHLSVRQLFAKAPHVLSALRPCWTMSPVLAAEMIPINRRLFDVVIFDEASQIPPAEAIGSLARAPQAVIAGDSRQLPPTSFFSRDSEDDGDDDDDAVALTADIESLLDAAGALLRDKMLQWHYRSRDDRLIAFSNNHIYSGSLTAFPGAIVHSPISHCLIPFRPITGGSGTRSNPDEVEKVVDLVLEHARETPKDTLGVIAFGQHHADNIENALTRRLGELNDSSLDGFFSETNEERFFVKNIERVQGDERDVIILSVGYHKDANGRLPYRFGPILSEGGERRLNVAVTRARSRLTLVSSFSHRDMDPGRSSAKGAELLRQYLEYAASGGKDLGSGVVDTPLNPFELSIKEGLERRGIPVTPQYGVSGYRIDFACAHPGEPGRMVLAIEADGASYHSSPTARDRDRLRQEVLEGKGWRFHRIWSTAWFRDREAELDKAEAAWKRAVEASERDEPAPVPAPSPRAPSSAPVATPARGPRPNVPPRGGRGYDSITDYRLGQLVQLVRWIESDTLLRTEDDLLREMMEELGFKRSGKRITDALTQAIEMARR